MIVNLPKYSYIKNDVLEFRIRMTEEEKSRFSSYNFNTLYYRFYQFDKNIKYEYIQFSTTIDRLDDITIEQNLSSLKEGNYCLTDICAIDGDACLEILSHYDFLFEIVSHTQVSKGYHELIADRDNILNQYFESINSGLGTITESSIEFEAYVFCKDIKLGKSINTAKATIFPYDSLSTSNIKSIIYKYLGEEGIATINCSDEDSSHDNPYNSPCIVIKIHRINANDKLEASNIAHDYVNKILKAISITNNSYGFIIGDAIVDKKNAVVHHRTVSLSYKGNLFTGMENPQKLHSILDKVIQNDLTEFYLGLYRDACEESDASTKYFKFWNLLESIARNQNYEGEQKYDFNDNKIYRGTKEVYISSNAREIVSELLRRHMNDSSKIKDSLNYGSIEDRIDIWYQRRNCTAHRGKCRVDIQSICDQSNLRMQKCRNAYDECFNSGAVDNYLFDLKYTTRDVIMNFIDTD